MLRQESGITFIGGGNMATAMIQGLESLEDSPRISVCDVSPEVVDRHNEAGRWAAFDMESAIGADTVVVLAVKPQLLESIAPSLRAALADGSLVISVLAGVTTETIEALLPEARVVRVMPNTPMAVGEGMSAVSGGRTASQRDVRLAVSICEPAGEVLVVPESRMDAITAVSGSGPAYFFRFCEVLMQAAREELDFSEAEARLLVGQTAKGAIAYLTSTEGFPAARLREQVTSKGGTTAAALDALNRGGIEEMTRDALVAAQDRSRVMSKLIAPSSAKPSPARPGVR